MESERADVVSEAVLSPNLSIRKRKRAVYSNLPEALVASGRVDPEASLLRSLSKGQESLKKALKKDRIPLRKPLKRIRQP